jgi:hypothetical protein
VSRWRPLGRDPASRSRLVDAVASVGITAAVLPLYLATLYPDVVASGDSAKFQYLGRVLGTAHPPGYPFYILVSHLFSYVPLGTLAWRMNLLSAVAGVLTSLCTFGAARRLGSGVAQSVGIALALATGLVFWNKSLAAEVYTLGALLLMFAIWRILVWRDGRQDRDLLLAVAALSFGLGNHLTIAVVAPAFLAFVFSTDARRATTPRVLFASAILLFAGIAQYGYILLRTWQHAPYVEARAETLAELYRIVRATKYDDAMFRFGWRTLLTVRIPLLGAQLLRELTVTGALLVCAGIVAGLRFRPREWILAAGSAGAILALTANVDADTAGFAAAAIPPLWLLAAFAPGMGATTWRSRRAVVPILVTALLAFTVGAELTANFRYADHSDRTIERRLWTAVFDAVPDRTAVIAESYVHDQGLLYMLAGEGVGAARQIELVQRDADTLDRAARVEGRTVVAFEDAVRSLRGSGFEFEPLRLLDWRIPELVPSSRRDRFVVVAIQPEAVRSLAVTAPDFVRRFGGTWTADARAGRYALVGGARGGSGAVQSAGAEVDLRVPGGKRFGGSVLPRPVEVRVIPGSIDIRIGDDPPFRTTGPLAVVALNEAGRVRVQLVPVSSDTLRPALEIPRVFRMTVSMSCAAIGDRQWHDLSRVAGRQLLLRLNNYRTYTGGGVMYVAAETPLTPHLEQTLGPEPARVTVESIAAGSRRERLRADALSIAALEQAPYLSRIDIRMNDQGGEATAVLDLGAEPAAIWGNGEADRIALPRVNACRRTVLDGVGR